MEVHGDKQNPDLRIVDDPFGEFTDLMSFNQYIGSMACRDEMTWAEPPRRRRQQDPGT